MKSLNHFWGEFDIIVQSTLHVQDSWNDFYWQEFLQKKWSEMSLKMNCINILVPELFTMQILETSKKAQKIDWGK